MLARRHAFSGGFVNFRVRTTLIALTIAELGTQPRLPILVRTASTPLLANRVVDIRIWGVLVEFTDFTGQTGPSFTTTYRVCRRRIARYIAYSCFAVGEKTKIFTEAKVKAEQNRKQELSIEKGMKGHVRSSF